MARQLNGEFVSCRSDFVGGSDVFAAKTRQMETDHRIANSIQFAAAMLRFESREITNVMSAHTALLNAAGRLTAIAHMHRELTRPRLRREVHLAEYLEPFCADILHSIGVVLEVQAADVTLRSDVASQICIILNELAMNAVKHGGKDGVPVILTLEALRDGRDRLCITLRDNGRGLPEDFSLQETSGLGMSIITSTVEKLGGSIRTVPGAGAGFEIDLPRERPSGRLAAFTGDA